MVMVVVAVVVAAAVVVVVNIAPHQHSCPGHFTLECKLTLTYYMEIILYLSLPM